LGIGDWGLGIGPNPQIPNPNPQSPIPNCFIEYKLLLKNNKKNIKIIKLLLILSKDQKKHFTQKEFNLKKI
jgi:hypothetical protein